MRNKRIELVPPFSDELIKSKSAKKQIELKAINKACLEEIELYNKGDIRQVTQKAVLEKVGKQPSWTNNQIGSHANIKKVFVQYFDAIKKRLTPEEKLSIQERYKELEEKHKKLEGYCLELEIEKYKLIEEVNRLTREMRTGAKILKIADKSREENA